jgi:hypothetical protein
MPKSSERERRAPGVLLGLRELPGGAGWLCPLEPLAAIGGFPAMQAVVAEPSPAAPVPRAVERGVAGRLVGALGYRLGTLRHRG